MQEQWNHKIFTVQERDFTALALEIFQYQYRFNPVYRLYTDAIGVKAPGVRELRDIPFLPIRFFKSHRVASGDFEPAAVFESSGTTGAWPSRHFVKDLSRYEESFLKTFELFYGHPGDYCILGLLPSYLERGNSSLVYMVDTLIRQSGHPRSGFYLHEQEKLSQTLCQLEAEKQPTLLLGVSFALLDFAEKFPCPLQHTIIAETGGMKGRRREMIRAEMHEILKKSFRLPAIHSEYGMTELLSQAWSKGEGIFQCPPWMKVLVRDEEDPLATVHDPSTGSQQGAINIIDLANIHSCSFIATDDAGRLHPGGRFEVLGRIDNSDLRGCSLMLV